MNCPENPPSLEEWQARFRWFNQEMDRSMEPGGYIVSEQACALSVELERLYCTGAWVAVVIVAIAVVDAQLREAELADFRGNTKDLIDAVNANPALHRLRKLRNTYVHVNPDQPAITVDQILADDVRLRHDAESAIKLVFEAFFMNPMV